MPLTRTGGVDMRIFFIPENPLVWLLVAALIVGVLVVAWFRQRFPSAGQKALTDPRYHQALGVYTSHLPAEDPTRDERHLQWGDRQQSVRREDQLAPFRHQPRLGQCGRAER